MNGDTNQKLIKRQELNDSKKENGDPVVFSVIKSNTGNFPFYRCFQTTMGSATQLTYRRGEKKWGMTSSYLEMVKAFVTRLHC